jgi:uncharacterized membrane protein
MRLSYARPLLLLALLALLAAASPLAGEPAAALVCRGHEPEWSLRIDGSGATLATLGTQSPGQTDFEGRLQEIGWARPPFLVYRGRAEASSADLVAVITREACLDTMADAAPGGGSSGFTARVSLPGGEVRLGCCSGPQAPEPAASPAAVAAAPATSPGGPVPPRPAAGPAMAAGGEIAALTLTDGTVCRSRGKGATLAFEGQRLNFDCGSSGVDKVGILGPLAIGPEGLLVASRAEIAWNEGLTSVRRAEPALARVSEIALADGLTCRFAGKGATLAFDSRRASFTCGMKDGDTVALLGDLEPVEAGFQIVRARIAHGEGGFALRSSEPILVTAPR